jgi:hypothetical protein
MFARFSSTARIIATRAPSTPLTTRRGFGPDPGGVSACTSTRSSPAFEGDRDARARFARAVAEEQRARVRHLGDAVLCLFEAADLIGRPETVLQCADEPQRRLPVALEVADDVDEVFEDAGARDLAVLRDVADEDHGRSRSFATRMSVDATSRT